MIDVSKLIVKRLIVSTDVTRIGVLQIVGVERVVRVVLRARDRVQPEWSAQAESADKIRITWCVVVDGSLQSVIDSRPHY